MKELQTKVWQPGIYPNMPGDVYRSIPAINSTALKKGVISQRHLQAALEGECEDEDSADRRKGRAIHCRLLEPDIFKEAFPIAKKCCATKKDGGKCTNEGKFELNGVWFCGTHKLKEARTPYDYLTATELKDVEGMAKSIKNHSVMELFLATDWNELSVVFECMGLPCKARLDKNSFENRITFDLKKGQPEKLTTDQCERQIADRLYHVQAAFYVDSLVAHGYPEPQFHWVFIEEKPPYEINVIIASEETIQIGRLIYRQILETWKRSNAQGKFHGYVRSLKSLSPGGLPAWYIKQYQGAELDSPICSTKYLSGGGGSGDGGLLPFELASDDTIAVAEPEPRPEPVAISEPVGDDNIPF